jgi:hypothetical protein
VHVCRPMTTAQPRPPDRTPLHPLPHVRWMIAAHPRRPCAPVGAIPRQPPHRRPPPCGATEPKPPPPPSSAWRRLRRTPPLFPPLGQKPPTPSVSPLRSVAHSALRLAGTFLPLSARSVHRSRALKRRCPHRIHAEAPPPFPSSVSSALAFLFRFSGLTPVYPPNRRTSPELPPATIHRLCC